MKYNHFLSIFVILVLSCFSANAIEMTVGDTKTLDIGTISNLQYAQWTISRSDCIEFDPTPSYYSKSATIKAVKAFTGAPCVVQCTYRYLELDPVTGKYTYSRSGYKSWSIFVSDNNSGGKDDSVGGDTQSAFIYLNTNTVSCKLGNWSEKISIYQFTSFNMTWSVDNPEIASVEPITYLGSTSTISEARIYGKKVGTTTLRVRGGDGSMATCAITIQSLSDGDEFYLISGDGENEVTLSYKVISATDKTCQVLRLPFNCKAKEVRIFNNVYDFEVTGMEFLFAMFAKETIQSITIPSTIKSIGSDSFKECNKLQKVEIADISSWCNILFGNEDANPLNYANHLYLGNSEVIDLIIPNSTEQISQWAFVNCKYLKSVEIPSSVNHINWGAFDKCTGLDEITSLRLVPPSIYLSSPFTDTTYQNAILKVPAESVEEYKSHYYWGKFQHIVALDEAPSNGITDIYDDSIGNWYIYTVNGTLIRNGVGKVDFDNLTSGIYILRIGSKSTKYIVH